MKRLPLLLSFLLFLALCASLAYWGLQLFKPPLRPVAAPARVEKAEISPETAATLLGGRADRAELASNYQLKGVIFSGDPHDSVAILSADGKPAQAIRTSSEVQPGVMVKEVHKEYVLLTEGGATKRVELPESAKAELGFGGPAPIATTPAVAPTTAPGQGRNIPSRSQAGAMPAPTPPAPPVVSGGPIPGTNAGTATQQQAPGTMTAPGASAPPTVVVSPPPSAPIPSVPVPPTPPQGGSGG